MIKSISKSLCIGCGQCADVCPLDVIRIESGKAEPKYPEECMTCYLCELACPAGAIYVHPFKQPFPTVFPEFLVQDQKGDAV